MKTTLMAFTALAGILAIPGGAFAQGNFQSPKPVIQPQVVRPVIAPPVDTSRLTKERDRAGWRELPEPEEPGEAEQAAGQPSPVEQTSLGNAVAPEPLPDSGRVTGMRRTPAVAFAPLPEERPGGGIVGAGPQPEPPTPPGDETAGLREADRLLRLEAMIRELEHLGMLEEAARLKDLEEAMAGPGSAGGSLGGAGGGQQGPSGWRDWVPDPNTGEGQAPELWNPGLPGTAAYNPGAEQGGGFVPPPRKPRGAGNIPGFGQTPGSARPSLGRDGRTSDDPIVTHHDDGSWTETQYDDNGERTERTYNADGSPRSSSTYDKHGRHVHTLDWDDQGEGLSNSVHHQYLADGSRRVWVTTYGDEPETSSWLEVGPLPGVKIILGRDDPNEQPSPDAPLAAGSMPCPATHRDCGPGAAGVSTFEKVAQPGRGDEGGTEQGFKASVEERRNVVTNPVDPGTQLNRGGGTGTVDYMHKVTNPGKE